MHLINQSPAHAVNRQLMQSSKRSVNSSSPRAAPLQSGKLSIELDIRERSETRCWPQRLSYAEQEEGDALPDLPDVHAASPSGTTVL
jgi:hypothetical protein